jgi:hypothetical protein
MAWGGDFNPAEKLKDIRLDIADYRSQVAEATGATIFFVGGDIITRHTGLPPQRHHASDNDRDCQSSWR